MTVFYYFINTNDINVILPLFIVAMSIVSLIVFANDIFIQESTEIHHTGRVRGLVMTASNAAWILGPLFAGILVSSTDSIENYKGIYIAAFAILLPLLYVVFKNFQYFKDPKYIEISTRETVIRILKNKDISKIFLANTVLQSFYAWMTVYVPIYLHQTIGFDWKEISIILTIMLIPFVLVDIPLGKLADKKWGEKELMITGFVILGVSTACLTLLGIKSLAAWATILFITRIGAATAEIMIETYFFKKIDGRDPEILSLFRITRPLAYFVAPVIATVALVYTTDQYLFVVFGLLALLTIYPISTIKDTN
jgi:MFS family permease